MIESNGAKMISIEALGNATLPVEELAIKTSYEVKILLGLLSKKYK
jgi:hypothetical protein